MSCLELVILILVIGFISMIEICAITTCVGRVIDQKMKTKMELERVVFKEEMQEVCKLIDTYFTKIIELFKS